MSILSVETKKMPDIARAENVSGSDLMLTWDGTGMKTATVDQVANSEEIKEEIKEESVYNLKRIEFVEDNHALAASSSETFTLDATVEGYTCLGLIDHNISNASSSGTGSSYTIVYAAFYDDATGLFYMKMRNSNSSASRIKINIFGLYLPEKGE